MGQLKQFFVDTYALVEMYKGSENYAHYLGTIGMVLTRLNLMEFHYSLLRTVGKEEADEQYERLLPFVINLSDEVIKRANTLKLAFRQRNLSYVDCIGYVLARVLQVPFLTGDEQFRDMENVEFVK